MSRSASGRWNNNCQEVWWDGKICKSICWQYARVFLNKHLSYAGSVRLTVGTVMWAKDLLSRKRTDNNLVFNIKWQELMLCIFKSFSSHDRHTSCEILQNEKWKNNFPWKKLGLFLNRKPEGGCVLWQLECQGVDWRLSYFLGDVCIHSASNPGTSVLDSTF